MALDGTGVKSYTQHTEPVGGDYGVSVFGTTATADCEHMWYAIAVPRADLSGNALKAGFELYGTASVNMSLDWAETPPATIDAGNSVTFNARYSGKSSTEKHVAFLVKCEDEGALAALSSYSYFEDGTIYGFDEDAWDNVAITGVEILDHNTFTVEPNEEVEAGLKAYSLDGQLYVNGLIPGEAWSVYSVTGAVVYNGVAESGVAVISLPTAGIYIVRTGGSTLKVAATN